MFLLSYFRTRAEALHLALSEDGFHFVALNDNLPILEGTVGSKTLRDPHIFCDQNGIFHLLATNGWNSHAVTHAQSSDLISWSPQKLLPLMQTVANTRNAWAPECFYDVENQIYRLIWSSTVAPESTKNDQQFWNTSHNHRIWCATTRDWQQFSDAELFFDPGYSVIDASIVSRDGGYLMAFKDERGQNRPGTDFKAIRVASSQQASGPWTQSDLVTPTLTEGPSLFRRGESWAMIFDHFIDKKYGAMQSADGKNWHDISQKMSFPDGVRHGTVCEIDAQIGENLRSVFR